MLGARAREIVEREHSLDAMRTSWFGTLERCEAGRRRHARAPVWRPMHTMARGMTGHAGSAAAPATRPWDEPGEMEARFEQDDTLSHRTVGALSWMFVNAGGQIVLQITVLAVLARLVSPTSSASSRRRSS